MQQSLVLLNPDVYRQCLVKRFSLRSLAQPSLQNNHLSGLTKGQTWFSAFSVFLSNCHHRYYLLHFTNEETEFQELTCSSPHRQYPTNPERGTPLAPFQSLLTLKNNPVFPVGQRLLNRILKKMKCMCIFCPESILEDTGAEEAGLGRDQIIHVRQGFSASYYRRFGLDNSLLLGAVLCIVGCPASLHARYQEHSLPSCNNLQ